MAATVNDDPAAPFVTRHSKNFYHRQAFSRRRRGFFRKLDNKLTAQQICQSWQRTAIGPCASHNPNRLVRDRDGLGCLRLQLRPKASPRNRPQIAQGGLPCLHARHILASALAAPAILRFGIGTAQAATTLKISHQFPGGSIDNGDFRDRLCRMFAAELAKRTGGEITAEIYPNSSLVKTNAQFSAMRKGALDISLYPLPYAGGELPETNIGLMPGLVSTYDQGLNWKKEPVGKALTDFLADKGIIILSWVWQAGGVASRSRPIVAPGRRQGPEGSRRLARDGHGAADRGRRRAVGAVERNLRGDADRRLRCRHHLLHQPDLVPSRGGRQGPDLGRRRFLLVHARAADDVEVDLRRACRRSIRTSSWRVGTEMEAFGKKGAQDDDVEVAKVYAKAGAKVSDLDAATVNKWRDIARDTAWKDYGAKTATAAKLLKLASDVSA